MSDNTSPTEIEPSSFPDPEQSGEIFPAPTWSDRTLSVIAGLPWWAIIIGVAAVIVLYSMVTSVTYQRIIDFLADQPTWTTDDLYEVVQVVGEPSMIVGQYVGETQDSVQTVINQLLRDVIDSDVVTRSGFLVREDPASVTVRTEDGEEVEILKSDIVSEERTEGDGGTQITIDYIDEVTVTGTLTDINGDRMTIRTVPAEQETFDKSRIADMESDTIPCPDDQPDCTPVERVTIDREGETITGRLTALSDTSLTIQDDDGTKHEIRKGDADYYYVPTLTIAINDAVANQAVTPGASVRIGYVEGTDIVAALDQMQQLDALLVPLVYAEGDAQASLVAYPDLDAALAATGSGEVDALIFISSGEDRYAVADWVDENPDAGVVLPEPPRECTRNCEATVKLKDDTVTGTVVNETENTLTVQTVAPEYVVIDRDQIVDNRQMKPGECALNNLRGCDAGIFLTLRVTFLAYGIALIIGLIIGLMRVQRNPILYAISTLYVEVIRGIPLLVILLYAGFVFSPRLRDWTGIELSDQWEAILGLAFGYGAFIAEIFRAGIQSVNRGQMEAARSLGMSYPQAMRYVILPQAVRVVLPPLGNDFIAMLKDSALISVLALPDLLQLGRLYISRTFRAFEGYNTVAIMYLLMTLFLSLLVRLLERRTRLPR
ncbi:MAG TPA: ABC transporter substrate-binding protein/permease [Aggregatilinea sp.]|jgi:polar amino acid transport system permease protein|uniref:ABC transporter substrate-binding protein/permease n=1 Tax=Aggregatilinea sp. TaxID=2806333 RepID=UPI002CBE4807|nr:ABC transporter substrate-binding protein/permease [Aggregatilinea sp.]HML23726.1 ABC transporter substrate-binding protein/permease [Aggregatilinea sp.]